MALVKTLKATAQDLTTSWVDYGPELIVDGHKSISVWLNIDINDTRNVRIRALAKHVSDGADEYNLPIITVSKAAVMVNPEYYEFDNDVDHKTVVSFDFHEIIPFVQFQIQAGTVGVTAGQALDSKYVLL